MRGPDRKIMHDDGQSAEMMLVSRFLYHQAPYHDTSGARAVLSRQTLFSHRCSCRTCRMWYRICVVATASPAWKACGKAEASAPSVRPLLCGLANTHSKHGRCGNGFVCVNVFESGVYSWAGRRSGDRVQKINRRAASSFV